MIARLNALPAKAGVTKLTPGITNRPLKRLPEVSSLRYMLNYAKKTIEPHGGTDSSVITDARHVEGFTSQPMTTVHFASSFHFFGELKQKNHPCQAHSRFHNPASGHGTERSLARIAYFLDIW